MQFVIITSEYDENYKCNLDEILRGDNIGYSAHKHGDRKYFGFLCEFKNEAPNLYSSKLAQILNVYIYSKLSSIVYNYLLNNNASGSNFKYQYIVHKSEVSNIIGRLSYDEREVPFDIGLIHWLNSNPLTNVTMTNAYSTVDKDPLLQTTFSAKSLDEWIIINFLPLSVENSKIIPKYRITKTLKNNVETNKTLPTQPFTDQSVNNNTLNKGSPVIKNRSTPIVSVKNQSTIKNKKIKRRRNIVMGIGGAVVGGIVTYLLLRKKKVQSNF